MSAAVVIGLQQHLPLAVLKLQPPLFLQTGSIVLQQHLPLAVLKLLRFGDDDYSLIFVATAPTACGIETTDMSRLTNDLPNQLQQHLPLAVLKRYDTTDCNSTYRLRYAKKGARQQRSEATMRPAHL